jgi:hypothetical protein
MPTYSGTITVELPFSVAVDSDEELSSTELEQCALEQNNVPSDAVVVDISYDEDDKEDEEQEEYDDPDTDEEE